jgi:DNA-directed RNA polymerase specialized sigma24 family protein
VTDSGTNDKVLQQIARGIDLLVALQVRQIQDDRSTKDMILMLAGLGLAAPEIARILGAPKSTVAPTVSRAKAGKSRSAKKRKAPRRAR